MLGKKELLSTYTKYLSFKKVLEGETPNYYSSISGMMRERDRFSRFIGGRQGLRVYLNPGFASLPECRKKGLPLKT